MKKKGGMEPGLLVCYLGQRIKTMAAFCLFIGIFGLVFYLYNLPSEAVQYGALLFGTAALLFLIGDFLAFCRKHRLLQQMASQVKVSLSGLPEPSGLLERDYQELLHVMAEEQARRVSAEDERREEMTDYYTLWAHQIKTPIAAMDLLLQQGAGGEQKGPLIQELFKIEQYADMALQYQRLESMASDLLLKEYDLDDMVNQAVKKFASTFIYKKIRLERRESEMRVLTDEKWLVFALGQIFSNALKYTQPGGRIRVYIDEDALLAAGRKLLIIEDTGIGIQAEDLPRIFERGFTGINGRADKRATGLGLYLCREILSRLSHGVFIESEPGRGTRVTLELTTDHLEVE